MKYNENTVVRLQLWDIAGQERFGNMTRVYYRDAAAAFIVFDLTRRGTFEAVRKWKEDLDTKVITSDGEKVGHNLTRQCALRHFYRAWFSCQIPTILLANKTDLRDQRSVTDDEVYKLSQVCRDGLVVLTPHSIIIITRSCSSPAGTACRPRTGRTWTMPGR